MCLSNYVSSKLVYGYDSENDDDCYLYHGAFALGGDTEEDFTRHHWMIDSGCTDHLSPFLDDFAHLGNLVRHAVETRTSLCLYFTSFTFHPTALLLSIHSELPISC